MWQVEWLCHTVSSLCGVAVCHTVLSLCEVAVYHSVASLCGVAVYHAIIMTLLSVLFNDVSCYHSEASVMNE